MRGATRKAYNDGGARVNHVNGRFAEAAETRKSRHDAALIGADGALEIRFTCAILSHPFATGIAADSTAIDSCIGQSGAGESIFPGAGTNPVARFSES